MEELVWSRPTPLSLVLTHPSLMFLHHDELELWKKLLLVLGLETQSLRRNPNHDSAKTGEAVKEPGGLLPCVGSGAVACEDKWARRSCGWMMAVRKEQHSIFHEAGHPTTSLAWFGLSQPEVTQEDHAGRTLRFLLNTASTKSFSKRHALDAVVPLQDCLSWPRFFSDLLQQSMN